MCVRGPVQPGGSGPVPRERGQHHPTAVAGPVARHTRGTAEIRPGL